MRKNRKYVNPALYCSIRTMGHNNVSRALSNLGNRMPILQHCSNNIILLQTHLFLLQASIWIYIISFCIYNTAIYKDYIDECCPKMITAHCFGNRSKFYAAHRDFLSYLTKTNLLPMFLYFSWRTTSFSPHFIQYFL